jgi:sugar lactone lactonase YvrE
LLASRASLRPGYDVDFLAGLLSFSPSGDERRVLVHSSQLTFPNDMAILPSDDDEGTVLFTDSTHKYQRRDVFLELLDMGANGRLLAYHPRNGTVEVVLTDLHFPNGVCLHSDGESVLINELTLFRVIRCATTAFLAIVLSWLWRVGTYAQGKRANADTSSVAPSGDSGRCSPTTCLEHQTTFAG